jgi:Fur family iron response transcriptional regulator
MDMPTPKAYSSEELVALLRARGINPTAQRLEIARVLFARCQHLSAEEVFRLVNTPARRARVSKATVYNSLGLFAAKGLIREVIADPDRVFYDPNTSPHHHFYDEVSGRLMDIDAHGVEIRGLPPIPEGSAMAGVDVIVRLRPAGAAPR